MLSSLLQAGIFFVVTARFRPLVHSFPFVSPAACCRVNECKKAAFSSSAVFSAPHKDFDDNQSDDDVDDNSEEPGSFEIGKGFAALSEEDAAELKAEAAAIINEKVLDGLEDISRLRSKMKQEMEEGKKTMQFAMELRAKEESKQLMNKIDKLTDEFMKSTESTRESTKLAAAASLGMESKTGNRRGLEMGTWGVVSGRTVVAGEGIASNGSLLGSVDNAYRPRGKSEVSETPENSTTENRILIVADTTQVRIFSQMAAKWNDSTSEDSNVNHERFP